MKTRFGLVSNSSSSSFILVFPKKPETSDEVFKLMYNGVEGVINSYGESKMTHQQIAERVFNDTLNKPEATFEELTEQFLHEVSLSFWALEEAVKRDEDDSFNAFTARMHEIGYELIWKVQDVIKKRVKLNEEHRIREQAFYAECGFEHYPDKPTKAFTKKYNAFWETLQAESRPIDDLYYNLEQEVAKNKATEFMNNHKGWWTTILEYEDHTHEGSLIEHGNVFRHMEHIQISNH